MLGEHQKASGNVEIVVHGKSAWWCLPFLRKLNLDFTLWCPHKTSKVKMLHQMRLSDWYVRVRNIRVIGEHISSTGHPDLTTSSMSRTVGRCELNESYFNRTNGSKSSIMRECNPPLSLPCIRSTVVC